jgi:hypothetical protein
MARLLEQARVGDPDGDKFLVDVAVPGEFLLKTLGCDKDGKPLVASGAPVSLAPNAR